VCDDPHPELDEKVVKEKTKKANESMNQPLVPSGVNVDTQPFSKPKDNQPKPSIASGCPRGQVMMKNGSCRFAVECPARTAANDIGKCMPVTRNPGVASGCPRGQVMMKNGSCRFAVECPAGTAANDIGKCIPVTRNPGVQGQRPSNSNGPCPPGQVLS